MSKEECVSLLTGVRLTRLACASANQPYVVPMYLAYHKPCGGDPCLYGFTTIGQKVEWMRANPLVCVELDEIAGDTQWVSVVVFGRYEELPAPPAIVLGRQTAMSDTTGFDDPDRTNETRFAHRLLEGRAMWWEPACSARTTFAHGDLAEGLTPIYFKVWIEKVSGYESTRDADGSFPVKVGRPGKLGWLRRALAVKSEK